MIDPKLQTRYARGCGMAALDYTAAANQAYFEATSQVIDFWSRALGTDEREAEQRSWYRHPDQGARAASATFPNLPNPFVAQASAWQAMITAPWTLTPAAWPAAFMMMSGGVPQSVAWPAAEATAAATDAAMAATEAVTNACASYRSDGGHAVAQIVMLPIKTGLAAAGAFPFASAFQSAAMPWQALFSPNVGF